MNDAEERLSYLIWKLENVGLTKSERIELMILQGEG